MTTNTHPQYRARIGQEVFEAVSCAEIISRLPNMADYDQIARGEDGDKEAFVARTSSAYEMASFLSELLAATGSDAGLIDIDALSPDELTALLGDRTVSFDLDQPWEYEVPLVVVSVNYTPFTDVPLPAGNVVVLDPTDELLYLRSLVTAGVLSMTELEPSEDDV